MRAGQRRGVTEDGAIRENDVEGERERERYLTCRRLYQSRDDAIERHKGFETDGGLVSRAATPGATCWRKSWVCAGFDRDARVIRPSGDQRHARQAPFVCAGERQRDVVLQPSRDAWPRSSTLGLCIDSQYHQPAEHLERSPYAERGEGSVRVSGEGGRAGGRRLRERSGARLNDEVSQQHPARCGGTTRSTARCRRPRGDRVRYRVNTLM